MKQLFFLALLSVVVVACTTSPDTASLQTDAQPNKTQPPWQEIAAYDGTQPTARHEAAFIGVEDDYYLLGGRGIKPVDRYDALAGSWTAGAASPVEIHHFQPVVHNGKILLLGAMTGKYPGETPLPNIMIYDPATDAWSTGPEIPAGRRRGGAGAVVHNGKIYLVCGITDGHRGGHVAWLDSYDPATNTWEQLPDAPRPRDHFQAVVLNNKLYALAGRTTIAATNPFANTIGEVDVYDFDSQVWSTLTDTLPTHRAGNAAIAIGEDILVLGGESNNQLVAHSEVEALNPVSGQWQTLDSLSRGRHGTGVIYHRGRLVMASGCGNHGGKPELADMIARAW